MSILVLLAVISILLWQFNLTTAKPLIKEIVNWGTFIVSLVLTLVKTNFFQHL